MLMLFISNTFTVRVFLIHESLLGFRVVRTFIFRRVKEQGMKAKMVLV